MRRILVLAPSLLLLLLASLFYSVHVDSNSMQPGISKGDILLIQRPWWMGDYPPGAVVAFRRDNGELWLKRIMARAGDRIGRHDRQWRINGQPVTQRGGLESLGEGESHRIWPSRYAPDMLEIVVPAGHVFLLGDHRGASIDSRRFGPVASTRLAGRACWILWPLSHFGPVH